MTPTRAWHGAAVRMRGLSVVRAAHAMMQRHSSNEALAALAAALYVIDHLFFALTFAPKTYFQKIADPADIAPTAAVAFTINHIAAVVLPAALGYLWVTSQASVFVLAAILAAASLLLALMIPRHPQPGRETIFSRF